MADLVELRMLERGVDARELEDLAQRRHPIVAEVLAEAENDAQRCQAHYYAGARLLTLGQSEEAAAEFEACLRVKVGCPEYALASVEKLCPLEGPASPGRKRRRPRPDRPR